MSVAAEPAQQADAPVLFGLTETSPPRKSPDQASPPPRSLRAAT